MTDVVVASTEADASAAAAIEQHHAELSGALTAHVEALIASVSAGNAAGSLAARDDLVHWARRELVPHATAEEETLYPAAQALDRGRLLVDGMLAEHVVIVGLVEQLGRSDHPVRAAAEAGALQAVFASHLQKENELILPLLSETPGVSLAGLLEGMHEQLGGAEGADPAAAGGCGCGGEGHGHGAGGCGCGGHGHGHGHAAAAGGHEAGGHACVCGETDGPGYPELDARAVPHAIRHATIFGALSSVAPGSGLVLVAPHDPLPLLAQIDQRWPGVFAVSYLERGPEAWRLSFTRAA